MAETMTREEKLYCLRHNVSNGVDGLEEALSHNIGRDNAGYFITPVRELYQKMEEELEKDQVDFERLMIMHSEKFWEAYFKLKKMQGDWIRSHDKDHHVTLATDIDEEWGLTCHDDNTWEMRYIPDKKVVWTSTTKDDPNIATEMLSQYVFDKMDKYISNLVDIFEN